MMARPSWEKPLRQKLRQWRKHRPSPRGIVDQGLVVLILFALQWLLADGGEKVLGNGGGGTGIAAVSGLIGAGIATSFRSRWYSNGWLLDWTPASPAVARRLKTREHLLTALLTIVGIFLLSCVTAVTSVHTSVATALAASALSTACGFMLAGGTVSSRLLSASFALVFFYSVFGGWLGFGEKEVFMRVADGAGMMWLPSLPWALATHGTAAPTLHLVVFAVALLISLYEWRGTWARHARREIVMPAEAFPAESGIVEEEDAPSPDDEQRQNIRQHVAFAWFGMAGYLPDGPMPRFERLLWRWFSPRERLLSCLGSQQSAEWFPRTRWSACILAVTVLLALLVPWAEENTSIGDHGFWVLTGFAGLAFGALHLSWPGRDSCFHSWLELMYTADLGQFPCFAVFPVTSGEWLRAYAKEWTVRGAWLSLLWSLAILLGHRGIAPNATLSWQIALTTLPWLLLATWFPLSVLHQLVRAVSGPAFRSHGMSRVLPAAFSGSAGIIAAVVVFVGIGMREFTVTAVAFGIAVLLGALSLWLSWQRSQEMRLDIKPRPIN